MSPTHSIIIHPEGENIIIIGTYSFASWAVGDEPLSDEEMRQLKASTEFVSGEEAKREFGLKVDLP